jgi:biotin operon repressor
MRLCEHEDFAVLVAAAARARGLNEQFVEKDYYVTEVLRIVTTPSQTTSEIATVTGLGRSTVGKNLAALERDSKVTRTRGEQRGGGPRMPDGWSKTTADRLRPGQLDPLVLDYVRGVGQPLGPVAVAQALGRSSGAVANCLARLAKAGELKQVDDKPRRYRLATGRSDTRNAEVQA